MLKFAHLSSCIFLPLAEAAISKRPPSTELEAEDEAVNTVEQARLLVNMAFCGILVASSLLLEIRGVSVRVSANVFEIVRLLLMRVVDEIAHLTLSSGPLGLRLGGNPHRSPRRQE